MRKRSSVADRQQLTIGDYVGTHKAIDGPVQYGLSNARRTAAWALAKRRGWTVRSDHRGFTKVFDPRTGNVCFSPQLVPAVWGLFNALKHVEEESRIFVEQGRIAL